MIGPELLIALVVVLGLILLMRWVFRPSRPPRAVLPSDATPGLLVPVATGLLRAEAIAVRTRLRQAEIRASLAAAESGGFDVRVFAADAEQARELLS
jgi:hypothetical protein